MELLAGARDERGQRKLRHLIDRAECIPLEPGDFEEAAALSRHCRREGATVRTLVACLIAALAIRADVPVLHRDADFDALARHTPLRIEGDTAWKSRPARTVAAPG